MKIRSAKRHIQEGSKNLFRNRLMSLASIITVSACSFIFIISFCMLINLDYILKQIESTIGISVFIEDSLPAEDVEVLMNEISKIEHVTTVIYISSDEALIKFKDELGDTSILDGLDHDNPLPRSFDVSFESARYQGSVLNALEGLKSKGIENIRHAKNEADMLIVMNTGLRVAAVIILVILSVISVTIIMNTIKITVYIRKNEINIMKYVGATDWFIRWPFIIEGILIGLIGSLIPAVICFMGYDKTISFIYEEFFVIQKLVHFKTSAEIFSLVMPLILLIGMFLGIIGSVSSIRRHLNV